jgi:hypothetical protein
VADFVFDENSYIRALYAERTTREPDLIAVRLLQCLQVGHRWILSQRIKQAYYRQFKRHALEHGRLSNDLIRSLRDVLFDSQAHLTLDELERVPGNYDHNDDHMVEAAAAVPGSILITLDGRLRRALRDEGIPERYGFVVADVTEAWRLLCNPSPAQRSP